MMKPKPKKKVLFGGAFDLIHAGHVQAIRYVKTFGDYLVINLSSDRQVAKKKGPGRPVIPQQERTDMLMAIKGVNEVVCMETDELDLPALLTYVKPQILITNEGNDAYDDICDNMEIKLVKIPRMIPKSGLDTTNIIKKIKGGSN